MHSGMRSTSALYSSYHCRQNQSSDKKPNPLFGEHYEQFNGQLQSAVNPSYSTYESYPMNQSQNRGFGVQQSSKMNNGPFYHPGFTSHPLREALAYSVNQPAAAEAQAQQVEVNRNAEEVLEVKPEPPIFPKSKPRLRWTPELHERFIRAATQLGGPFKATPKAILKRMTVEGLTLNQLKSHLQIVRYKNPNKVSVEETMGHGMQNNANSHAPQFTEGEVSSSYRPKFESEIGNYRRLLRSSENVRYKNPNEVSVEKTMGHGMQNNARSHAPQFTEGEVSSSYRPKFESEIGNYMRLLRSSENVRYKNPNEVSVEKTMGHGIQNNANSHAPQFKEGEVSSRSRPKFESDIGN